MAWVLGRWSVLPAFYHHRYVGQGATYPFNSTFAPEPFLTHLPALHLHDFAQLCRNNLTLLYVHPKHPDWDLRQKIYLEEARPLSSPPSPSSSPPHPLTPPERPRHALRGGVPRHAGAPPGAGADERGGGRARLLPRLRGPHVPGHWLSLPQRAGRPARPRARRLLPLPARPRHPGAGQHGAGGAGRAVGALRGRARARERGGLPARAPGPAPGLRPLLRHLRLHLGARAGRGARAAGGAAAGGAARARAVDGRAGRARAGAAQGGAAPAPRRGEPHAQGPRRLRALARRAGGAAPGRAVRRLRVLHVDAEH